MPTTTSNPQYVQRPFSIAFNLKQEQKYDDLAQKISPNLIKELPVINKEIQALIDKYNGSDNRDHKIIVLRAIQKKIQETDERFSCNEYSGCALYQTVHNAVLDEVKYQYQSLGCPSVLDQRNASELTEIIANMSSEKADALGALLQDGADKKKLAGKLITLYGKKDKSPEAIAFRNFLASHHIEFLGGDNSLNYKVTNAATNTTEVLKLNISPQPLRIATDLEAKNKPYIASSRISRQVKFTAQVKASVWGISINLPITHTKNIQVVDFFPRGSVLNVFKPNTPSYELGKNLSNVFVQMAHIFQDLEETGFMFPDGKINNWLLDAEGGLHIADLKTVFSINQRKESTPEDRARDFSSLMGTIFFSPPEILSRLKDPALPPLTLGAHETQAYLLGQNIYFAIHYAQKGDSLNPPESFKNYPFFKTVLGKEYLSLIEDLTTSNPKSRLSLSEARNRLEYLGHLSALEAVKIGSQDAAMDAFIAQKLEIIKRTHPAQRQYIFDEIHQTVQSLKTNTNPIKNIIEDFDKKGNHRFLGMHTSVNMHKKANRIRQAIAGVNIEERCKFQEATQDVTSASYKVMEAIASHRHLCRGFKKDDKGKIVEKTAAKSYTKYKSGFFSRNVPAAEEKLAAPDRARAPVSLV